VITGFIVARNIGKKYMYETGNYLRERGEIDYVNV